MKKSFSFGALRIAAVLSAVMSAATPVFAAGYSITSLGIGNQVLTVNNLGQTAGIAWANGGAAALFTGGVTSISGNVAGEAWSINDSGQVVGSIQDGNYKSHAFLYSNGSVQSIVPFGGTHGIAYGINNAGQVVGAATDSNIVNHAFIYQDGVVTDLGTMGGNFSAATGINNKGQVVGYVYGPISTKTFLYDNGGVTVLGVDNLQAAGINDSGQIIGQHGNVGVLFENGVMTKLGSFMTNGTSWASGLNNLGQVVGHAQSSDNEARAFLYSDGKLLDLNGLLPTNSGWFLDDAFDINERGQIVGLGRLNGQVQGFILSPSTVPIPAAAYLFGSALVGLMGFGRRRTVR